MLSSDVSSRRYQAQRGCSSCSNLKKSSLNTPCNYEEIDLAPLLSASRRWYFHVHIMYNHGDPAQKERAKVGIQKLMEKVVSLEA